METREYSICGFSINYLIKVLIFLMFITFCFYGLDVSAQENKKIETVIIEGVGATVESASINAGKNAVRQVVGMYTVTDTVVENSKLIKDQILSNSNGFIKSFKILSTTENDGLFYVEAKVEVVLGSVISRLNDNNIATHNIGSTGFKVVALDKYDTRMNFKNLADKIIFEPLKTKNNVYNLKINDFKVSDKYTSLDFEENYQYNKINKQFFSLNFKDRDEIIKLNLGELIIFGLDFKISLDTNYLNSINEFLIRSTTNNNVSKFNFSIIKFTDGKSKIKKYYLSKSQRAILAQLINNFLDNYYYEIKINLMSESKKIYSLSYWFSDKYSDYKYNSPGFSETIIHNYDYSKFESEFYESYKQACKFSGKNLLLGITTEPLSCLYMLESNYIFTSFVVLDRESISKIDNITITSGWHKYD